MAMRNTIILIFLAGSLFFSCKTHSNSTSEDETAQGRVPVTITHPETGDLADVLELSATSAFLLKTTVKAPVAGYLKEVNVQLGASINKGAKLFTIQSKEAASLGSSVSMPDSSIRFSGMVAISASGSGYITQLGYRVGDYVQEGETLAEISDASSLVFLLNLPYELKPFLQLNKNIELNLPDGEQLKGTLSKAMPSIDPVSQTQQYVVNVSAKQSIPENLIAKARFVKAIHSTTVILPKEAIVTNETQSEFWIMKMIDSITAVKVPVTKGIETSDKVEVLSPQLLPSEQVLLTGNYGLPDTALVSISTGEE